MRFLSLFSGIEAASVAWLPLGWRCVGVAEVNPFACALLACRYPDVPNLGDVTAITAERLAALGPIDVVVAGFPCQDVSIAGRRAGLEANGVATRSGLFHEALRLVRACGARWTVLENVPGLFSSHRGRDFATVVGTLAGCAFDVPDGGWGTAGVAAGQDGLVEWGVLDAQFFGLAQRRQRVFLVRDSGAWADRPPVLLEPASLRGDPPPRREAQEGVARPLAGGAAGSSGYRHDADTAESLIVATLRGREHAPGVSAPWRGGEDDANLVVGQCHGSNVGPMGTLRSGNGNETGGVPFVTHALCAEGHDASEDGSGRGVPLVAMSRNAHPNRLDAESETLIPAVFDPNQITSRRNGSVPTPDLAHTLPATPHAPVAFNWQSGGDARGLEPKATAALSRTQTPAVVIQDVRGPEKQQGGSGLGGDTAYTPVCAATGGVLTPQAVRRLTPRECERLQGFPDDWTLVPVGKKRKPAADGPRYRALGNSMAVPVMRWIGERLARAAQYVALPPPPAAEPPATGGRGCP